MAKQTINIGSADDDGTGDDLRDAFDKANDNFTELYDFKGGTVAVNWSAPQTFDNLSGPYFTAVAATPGFRATQTLVSDIGTPASSAALGGIHIDASGLGTAAQDDIAASISFGRKGAGRRGAMIAGLHTSSDVNQMGIGVYLKSSTTAASSALVLRWKWDHAGNFLPAIDNNVTVGSASLRMLGGHFVKLNISGLATYADNTAAIAGGLVAGDLYRTATGVLMVRY